MQSAFVWRLYSAVPNRPVSPCQPPPQGLAEMMELPATFTGSIPCDDCERVDIVLNIRPDAIYQLRKTYQSADGPLKVDAQLGRWRFTPDDNLLILGKERGRLKTYRVVDNELLRFVEWQGADNSSQIQYALERSTEKDPFTDVVKMRGMFRYTGDRATFAECSSGATFGVDEGGDYRTTAQWYMNTPHGADDPLLVSILGSLRRGTGFEGPRENIFISQFRRFYPNRDCGGNMIRTSLTGTFWLLDELNGKPVGQDGDPEPRFITFDPDKTLHGYGGCNDIVGVYLIKGDVFLFNREMTTRVACGSGMALENQMLHALDEAESYRVEDEMLLLFDQNEKVLARFQAGP